MAKILVVDDLSNIRELLQFHLSLEGHEVLEAENGHEAIDLVGKHQPEVMILDVMMPEIDGFEVLEQLRSNPANDALFIIMLSARGETRDKVSGLDTGADAYLTKPFQPDELKAMVRAGLRTVEKRYQAMYDGLTGLFNRRVFDDMLMRELASVERYGTNLTLVMIDLDHFKAVNDTFGHAAGDIVLKELSKLLHEACRPSDLPCRWGGEEFAWLLPETNLEGGILAAERLCKAINDHPFPEVAQLTASLGVAIANNKDSSESFCKRADDALYQAKENGRNCVKY